MNFKKFTNYQFKLYLNSVKSNNRIISLDLGSNNVGIAISDYQLKQSFFFKTIKSNNIFTDKNFAKSIRNICEKQKVQGIIFGQTGIQETDQKYRIIINKIGKLIDIPYTMIDQTNSTLQAKEILYNFEKTVQRYGHLHDQKQLKDGLAAMIIMQKFLLYYHNLEKSC